MVAVPIGQELHLRSANDHTDHRWDDRVLEDLASVGRRLKPLAADLEARLARFSGYATRYGAALARAERGERRWVDDMSRDSCQRVRFELHEDLIASLGLREATKAAEAAHAAIPDQAGPHPRSGPP